MAQSLFKSIFEQFCDCTKDYFAKEPCKLMRILNGKPSYLT